MRFGTRDEANLHRVSNKVLAREEGYPTGGALPQGDRMDFGEVDRLYTKLKEWRDAKSISNEEFDARIKEPIVQDDEGRWWAKSRTTGESASREVIRSSLVQGGATPRQSAFAGPTPLPQAHLRHAAALPKRASQVRPGASGARFHSANAGHIQPRPTRHEGHGC
jgi:hypothetical protein